MGIVKRSSTENSTKDKELDVLCSECNRDTTHLVISSLDLSGSEEFDEAQYEINWNTQYQILQCQGCRSVCFRKAYYFSEADDDEQEPDEIYPRRGADMVKTKDFWTVPPTIKRIYLETAEAYNSKCFTLCAAGLRAMVEGICVAQGITGGNIEIQKNGATVKQWREDLRGKISGLHEKELLTKSNADILHEHRFLGNEAVHELAEPSTEELSLALQITEHVLEQLYEIPEKARQLKAQKAKRTGKV